LRIAGNHHLALVVEDKIDETHRFWTETMGLRFSWAVTNLYIPSTGQYSPHMHTFYELSKQGNVAYFAIQPETMQPGPNWQDSSARFIALQAASEDQLPQWKKRLEAAGVAAAEEVEEDGRPALFFRDPEGHRFKLTPPARTYTPQDAEKAQKLVERWIATHRTSATEPL
jgi:catechol 2,3-dioxygenase-like lactoylglutathione lyase family enzyme